MGRFVNARSLLIIELVPLERSEVMGIYGDDQRLPERMRWLAPDAAVSFRERLAGTVRVSDMYRTAEMSLRARRVRAGSQRPGFSGHNYGFSIDLDVNDTLRREFPGREGKRRLDLFMAKWGWFCHRRDHRRGFEDWHYNYGIQPYLTRDEPRTSGALERKIRDVYGAAFTLTAREIQTILGKLRLYAGAIDGDIGPITTEAVRAFQRTWTLREDGIPGPITQRTLAFVTSSVKVGGDPSP